MKKIWKKPGMEERRLMKDLARKGNLRFQNFQSRIFPEQVPLYLISKVCNLPVFWLCICKQNIALRFKI